MKTQKYISQFGKEYEISFKVRRDIPDMESYLYRFQVFVEDNVFGCDFTITEQKIKRYSLSENEIINICFDLIREILDNQVEEYCSINIGKNGIIEYLIRQNDSGRIEN
ncbi:MAG: hypothetical protein HWN67_14095 [Candidatus Helarchaeota archaeon]|nr:hypothetical protein [Candidatus Helarchaeota archaeon]